jgi:hypothetical protein
MSVITPHQRNALLIADRTREVEVILREIEQVMVDNPFLTLLDIEMVFRDAAAATYLVMGEDGELSIVFGMMAWSEAMADMLPDNTDRAHSLLSQAVSINHARLLQSERMADGKEAGTA